MKNLSLLLVICLPLFVSGQDYFLKDLGPYDPSIPSPESFLGYPIGDHHTRYDRIVTYLQTLAELSDKASIEEYGMTYEYRPLVMLSVTSIENLKNLESLKSSHLKLVDPKAEIEDYENQPIFINLGYGVHGNEPSSAEAAMLTAYVLVASRHEDIANYLQKSVIFIDPTINPDGRDRHTHWANMYKGNPVVDDPLDVEHNEGWPRGRTNHYWFDLNRDWWLGIHPESRSKLKWYHKWYPNVVTDFHEMGSNSTYFFEPMKANASKDPIMPVENYTALNETFARYFVEGLDAIGSLYFAKDVFDGTYPGYGSSYPDLQGGLALLFEQASSRGHKQKTDRGEITFAFTIRNQFISSFATIKASVENREMMHKYQHDFFKSAITRAKKSAVKGYVFGDPHDKNRVKAFMDKLFLHQIDFYQLKDAISKNGIQYDPEWAFVVPTEQDQYRMVQSVFETYDTYADSVFYDASAWSLANFYNIDYAELSTLSRFQGEKVNSLEGMTPSISIKKSSYAYLIPWEDYNTPAVLNALQEKKIRVSAAFKPFQAAPENEPMDFHYGTLVIPIRKQEKNADALHQVLEAVCSKYHVTAYPVETGYNSTGVDLGNRYVRPLEKPKVIMLVGDGVSGYEAGEVWHLLDQRVHMPITKVSVHAFNRIDFNDYSTMVLVSGSYSTLDSLKRLKIKNWVSEGNTLITIRSASKWAIDKKLVKEALVKEKSKENKEAADEKKPMEKKTERKDYVGAPEELGKVAVGGAIFKVDLDITHPLGFGYRDRKLPVYRNSTMWIAPSKNAYSTVAKYTDDPHIDGFITDKNLETFLKPSASLIVSQVGSGRVVMFADNPNFRGSWYGTNKLFLNAIFFGQHIGVPTPRGN